MVRLRSMRLLLRQPKHRGVLKSNSPPLMPAMPLLLSPHILLSAVLTPVSILRTTKTVFPQHALLETYFQSSRAYEAPERALSWETFPRA